MKITSENYVENVIRTDSPVTPELISRLSDPSTVRLLHAAMGLCTESAELMDMLKKHVFYGKPLDRINAVEETGDAMWYAGLAIDELRVTMNDVLTLNIEKLKLRYPGKFNGTDAVNRNTVAERLLLESFDEKPISKRGKDWLRFSAMVLDHIEQYTVPQYGDRGEDQVTNWSGEECLKAVDKYRARSGKNIRPGQEMLDLLKMAHFIQLAFDKTFGIGD